MTTSARPFVGVSSYVEDVDRSPWRAQRSALVPHRYIAHLERAGALVVVLPPRPDADDEMAHAVLDRIDALVIAGGRGRRGEPVRRWTARARAAATARPGRLGARPRPGVGRSGPAGARDLPGHAGDGGGCRWRPRTAPAGPSRARRALPTSGRVRLAPRRTRRGHSARRAARHPTARRPDLPPPGGAARVAGGHAVPGVGVARGRDAGGDGGPHRPLPARGPVASGGGGGRAALRRPRGRRRAARAFGTWRRRRTSGETSGAPTTHHAQWTRDHAQPTRHRGRCRERPRRTRRDGPGRQRLDGLAAERRSPGADATLAAVPRRRLPQHRSGHRRDARRTAGRAAAVPRRV